MLVEGHLPSFEHNKELRILSVGNNQFSGSYFSSIFVYPSILPVVFFFAILT